MRNTRYSTLLPEEIMANAKILVVGVGAIGKTLAEQLAAMGFNDISICDFDDVAEANYGTQGYRPEDLKAKKVCVVSNNISMINPDCDVTVYKDPFNETMMKHITHVFMCVDDMQIRRDISIAADEACAFMIDGRMALQTMTIVTANSDFEYRKNWFPDAEAEEASCTTKSTFYCASAAASIMISILVKRINNQEVPSLVRFSLIDYSIIIEGL